MRLETGKGRKPMFQKIFALVLSCSLISVGSTAFASGTSNDDILAGLEDTYIPSIVAEEDFNDYTESNPFDSKWKVNNLSMAAPANVKGGDDTSLGLTVAAGSLTEFWTEFSTPLTGVVAIRVNYQFSENDKHRKLLFTTQDQNYKGENNYFMAHNNGKGLMRFGEQTTTLMEYEPGVWYDMLLVIDINSHTYDFFVNGQQYIDGEATPDTAFQNIKKLFFIKHWDENNGPNTTYIDDIKIYQLKPLPAASFYSSAAGEGTVTDAMAVPHMADSITLRFTAPMDAESLEGKVRLTKDNAPVDAVGSLSDDKTQYTLTLKEILVPDASYKVAFSEGIVSTEGIALITESVDLKTAANVITNLRAECDGTVVTNVNAVKGKTVAIKGDYAPNAAGEDVLLFAALYNGNRIETLKSAKAAAASGELTFDLDIPDDAAASYTIKIFAWDNAADMASYTDCITILP